MDYAQLGSSARFVVYYRPIFLVSFLKEVFSEKCYPFPVGFLFHEEGSPLPAKIF